MGILDQLFGDDEETQDGTIGPDGWVNIAASLASHQAMQDGFSSKASTAIQTFRPPLNCVGSIDVTKTIKIAKSYKDVILADQLEIPGQRPTADDVVANGIKNGSKVVIYLYNSNADIATWDSLAKRRTSGDGRFDLIYFDKFSVMSIVEPRNERYQLHQTFGANIIKSFGEQPLIMTLSGSIVNGQAHVVYRGDERSMDWGNAFQRIYHEHFKLEKCAKHKRKIRIVAQDTVFDGYLLSLVTAVDAENQGLYQTTINFIVSHKRYLKQNDSAIPGMIQQNGFRLPGKNIPSEYFPKAVLEEYFSQDFNNVVKNAYYSSASQVDRYITKDLANIDSLSAELIYDQIDEHSGNEINYVRYGTNIQLDPYLVGGNLDAALRDFALTKSVLDAKIYSFNIINLDSTRSDDIGELKKDSPLLTSEEYVSLRSEQARVRLLESGLRSRITQANKICQKIRLEYQKSQQMARI